MTDLGRRSLLGAAVAAPAGLSDMQIALEKVNAEIARRDEVRRERDVLASRLDEIRKN